MVGSISATAVYVESLPTPPQLMVGRPPPSVQGGADNQMALASAKMVEQIGAVNRQRLQVFVLSSRLARMLRVWGRVGRDLYSLLLVCCGALSCSGREQDTPIIGEFEYFSRGR